MGRFFFCFKRPSVQTGENCHMSKLSVFERVGSQGAMRGAPRTKKAVRNKGNKAIPKPKGYHGGKLNG